MDRAAPAAAAQILRALRALGKDITTASVERELRGTNEGALNVGRVRVEIRKAVGVHTGPFALTIRDTLHGGIRVGRRRAAEDAPERIAREAFLAANRPTETARAAKWAEKRSAALVVDVTKGVRGAIRVATADALKRGAHAGELASNLRNVIGLDERRAQAVVNFRTAQLEAGFDPALVETRAAKYASRLLGQRAEAIARTEIFAAVATGRREFWNELVADGVVEAREVTRTWVASGAENMCPECEDLDGETAGLNESFPGGHEGTPAHTSCVCTETLSVD